MGEKPELIERHIRQTRHELGDNLNELQQKVKNAVDWRAQFKERPMTMIGVAFGGGVLLSTLAGRRRSGSERWPNDDWAKSDHHPVTHASANFDSEGTGFNPPKRKSSDLWENIKGALVAISASKVSEYLDQVVPGFQEHYRKVASDRQASGANGHDRAAHNVVM